MTRKRREKELVGAAIIKWQQEEEKKLVDEINRKMAIEILKRQEIILKNQEEEIRKSKEKEFDKEILKKPRRRYKSNRDRNQTNWDKKRCWTSRSRYFNFRKNL